MNLAASLHLVTANHERRPIPGGFVDQQLKQLMKELGEAINESLSDSESIAEVVSRIKEGGHREANAQGGDFDELPGDHPADSSRCHGVPG